MVKATTSFTDDGLSQPWLAWVKQKNETEDAAEHSEHSDSKASVDAPKMCPGGPSCSFESHAAGTTIYCAAPADGIKKDVIPSMTVSIGPHTITSANLEKGTTVTTTLRYLADDPLYDTEKPFQVIANLCGIPGARASNHKYVDVDSVKVTDIRSLSWKPELDREGFQLVKLDDPLENPNFESDAWIRSTYYPWVKAFLKKFLSAKEVRIFEHQLRFRQPGFEDKSLTAGGPFVPPVQAVHAEWPLALCDAQSIDAKEIRGSDLIHEDYNGESGLVFANPKHRWSYASEQKYNEGWLLKLFDSDPSVANNLDSQGFAPRLRDVGEMANRLLAERDAPQGLLDMPNKAGKLGHCRERDAATEGCAVAM
ncbi:hypothetical protein QQZ08_003538 [Neonectria magnoliae]|uniref:Uncharacterized protein n=1 Tax=Neonectria magnoliae TaxID=2732573 RepID=A0ABR1IAP0_9HYPO